MKRALNLRILREKLHRRLRHSKSKSFKRQTICFCCLTSSYHLL